MTGVQRRADERFLARFERGVALPVSARTLETAARRIQERNAERRREVTRLVAELAEMRRAFDLAQYEVARAIGTSQPTISAVERVRTHAIAF